MPTALALATAEAAEKRPTPSVTEPEPVIVETTLNVTAESIASLQTVVADTTTIWREWNKLYVTTAGSGTTAANIRIKAWSSWNEGYVRDHGRKCYGCEECSWTTASSTTSINDYRVWRAWNYQYESELPGRLVTAGAPAIIHSDEEWRRRAEEDRRRYEEAERKRKEAEAKAEELLRMCLSKEQIESLVKKNCFFLTTHDKDGKLHRYRIDRGSHGNVKRVDEKGNVLESLCFQPQGVPAADAMLAQKLILEADLETARRTANITDAATGRLISRSQA